MRSPKAKERSHIVNASATANGMSIGQQKIDSKSNEITAIPKLHDLLDVKVCLASIDARVPTCYFCSLSKGCGKWVESGDLILFR